MGGVFHPCHLSESAEGNEIQRICGFPSLDGEKPWREAEPELLYQNPRLLGNYEMPQLMDEDQEPKDQNEGDYGDECFHRRGA